MKTTVAKRSKTTIARPYLKSPYVLLKITSMGESLVLRSPYFELAKKEESLVVMEAGFISSTRP